MKHLILITALTTLLSSAFASSVRPDNYYQEFEFSPYDRFDNHPELGMWDKNENDDGFLYSYATGKITDTTAYSSFEEAEKGIQAFQDKLVAGDLGNDEINKVVQKFSAFGLIQGAEYQLSNDLFVGPNQYQQIKDGKVTLKYVSTNYGANEEGEFGFINTVFVWFPVPVEVLNKYEAKQLLKFKINKRKKYLSL